MIAAASLLEGPIRTRELVARMRQAGVFPDAEPYSREDDRHVKKVGETLRHLEVLGLIQRNVPGPGWARPVDRAGLRQVARGGAARYARGQGLTPGARVRP